MSLSTWLVFALAAGVGASTRFGVDDAVRRRTDPQAPWGILTVNVVGCLALGVVIGLGRYHGLDRDVATIVGTGGLGAFTTFSTFSVETVRLAQIGATARAVGYVFSTLVLGVMAAAGGLGLTALW